MGLAGRPEEPAAFLVFRGKDADIYVARDVWERLARETGRLQVLMPGYGTAWFGFEHCDEGPTA